MLFYLPRQRSGAFALKIVFQNPKGAKAVNKNNEVISKLSLRRLNVNLLYSLHAILESVLSCVDGSVSARSDVVLD
jgi:hypothetical protein